ncbi:MAG TPA: apolipoprotein N-acyltransferase [Xanthobacteraceae bacterium]|nr:apolipoprotein N-acyltransferase [Xanthobacteraceae bacterium]
MTLAALAYRVVLSSGWQRRLIAISAGALSALAMAPYNLWPVLAITLPVFVWLLDGTGTGRAGLVSAFASGWWFGFGYFLAGLYWIGLAFLVEADRFAWLLPVAVMGLPAYLAFFTGFGAVIARLLWTPGPSRIFAFALGLGIAEWLRGHVLTGFPWNSFGYALAAVPAFAQAASLVGLWGLTFIALAVFASPAALTDRPEATRRPWLPIAIAAIVLAAVGGYGLHRLATIETGFVEGAKLRIMQPNLPQDQKFQASAKHAILDRYTSISDRATAPGTQGMHDVTHLFWPESAFPFFLEQEADALARIADLLRGGAVLVTGAARLEEARPPSNEARVYNSIRVIGSDGAIIATTDKVHLVPFGEYLPFQDLLERIGLEQLTRVRGGFAAAPRLRALSIPRLPLAAPLVCYEAIFPGDVIPEGPRPAWMLNVSNDAWFGMSAGPYQHFAQARLRTIEEGLPLVRATNNGISAVVDPLGRIVNELPLGQDGVLDSRLPLPIAPPFYARYHEAGALMLAALFGAIAIFARRRKFRVAPH